jgi:hypothetical protein
MENQGRVDEVLDFIKDITYFDTRFCIALITVLLIHF